MYHSINIENIEKGWAFNTYSFFDAQLIPASRPLIKSPEVKKQYVDIPGSNGSLDYTEALNGLLYNNRKGSWEFYVNNNYQVDDGHWNRVYSDLLDRIHGKYFDHIWLEDDYREDLDGPDYYYTGRVFVNEWRSDPQFSKIVLDYDLDPYKIPTPEPGKEVSDWLWNDLYGEKDVNPIRYGKFKVDGTKDRTILGSPGGTIVATASTVMSVALPNGQSVPLPANTPTSFLLSARGRDRLTFTGYGTVVLSYDRGPTL